MPQFSSAIYSSANSKQGYIVSFVLFTLPFLIYVPFVIEETYLPRFIFLSISSAIVSVYYYVKYKDAFLNVFMKSFFQLVSIAMFLFALVLIADSIMSIHLQSAFVLSARYFIYLYFFALISALLSGNYIDPKNILAAVFLGIVIALIVSFFQLLKIYFGSNNLLSDESIYAVRSVFAHKNIYSSVLFLGIPFIVLFGKYYQRQTLSFFILLLVMIMLFYLQSRAVLLSMFTSVVVSSILTLFFFQKFAKHIFLENKKFVLLALSLLLITFTFAFLLNISQADGKMSFYKRVKAVSNIGGDLDHYNYTLKERLFLWDNTFDLIKERPIVGYGTGNWRFIFPSSGISNSRAAQGKTIFQRAHNDWLQIWFENGLIGVICYLLIFISILFQLNRSNKSNAENQILLLMILFVVVGWCCLSFFDFPNERMIPFMLLLVLTAFVFNKSRDVG